MGADVRRGKCCCTGCDWPVIATTSAHLVTHLGPDVQPYGSVVNLSTPSGTLPGAMTFYNDWSSNYNATPTNHWHAAVREDIMDINVGDRAGWNCYVELSAFQVYNHALLGREVDCDTCHDMWEWWQQQSNYNPLYYAVGIPAGCRLFIERTTRLDWASAYDTMRLALIWFNETWNDYEYRPGLFMHQLYTPDTMPDAWEVYYNETDNLPTSAYSGTAFCIYRCNIQSYFSLIKNLQ